MCVGDHRCACNWTRITDFVILCTTRSTQMNISLTSELDQFVSEKVKTGMYQTASEVIREGLRLLKERDQRLESLRREVRDGFDAIGRGEFSEYDAGEIKELSDRVNARGRKRLIAEKSKIGTS